MPLINETFESLNHIDSPASPTTRTAILATLNAQIPSEGDTSLHPSIPPISETTYITPFLALEQERASTSTPLDAISLSRYESPSIPPSPIPASILKTLSHDMPASHTHLTTRSHNLDFLSYFGRNAWLIGNSELEAELGALEREIATVKEQKEEVDAQRREAQESAKPELEILEEGWKKGIGKVLEVEAAAEGLRRRILEERRRGAGGHADDDGARR